MTELVPLILVKNDEFWLPYCLAATRGKFNRYVIYDVGSTDATRQIIQAFVDAESHRANFFIRYLPHVAPIVQGTFRNSMIAEARADWYLILDADEVYDSPAFDVMKQETDRLQNEYEKRGIIYGVVPRIEVLGDLKRAYGLDLNVSHHRLYHRTAIFGGPHPGEYPIIEQTHKNELWLNKSIICYHFHNTARSSKDEEVPKRIERREKGTYHPGEAKDIDLFKRLPILRRPVLTGGGPINPELAKLQNVTM